MSQTFSDSNLADIHALLTDYLDGLYDGDLAKFERVFHPNSHLYSSDGDEVVDLPRAAYFELIAGRDSPRKQGLKRYDQIVSVHIAGPNTAHAVVHCAIPPRYFTDYLTLLCLNKQWRIISKTFHTDIHD